MRPPRAARLQRPNEFVDDASDCQQAQEAPEQKEHQLHSLFRRGADESVKADSGRDLNGAAFASAPAYRDANPVSFDRRESIR